MLQRNAPIAVFDSGLGGISVLRELVKQLPREQFLYFGDSVHAPYGPRSAQEVSSLTMDCWKSLYAAGCKSLVVACNTATSAAIDSLRQAYPAVPIIGIEPALKPAVVDREHPRVLVMATEMTLKEERFRQQMESYQDRAEIFPLPAPGLVEFVEQGVTDSTALDAYLQEILAPYLEHPVDAVVLGCTHFAFVRGAIEKNLGYPVTVYDGAEGTARETKRRLEEAGLLCDGQAVGGVKLTNSLNTAEILERSQYLLNL